MLKWVKRRHSNKEMSGAVKQKTAAASSAPSKNHGVNKKASNGSATLSYPAEVPEDVNMNEVDGLVNLDVTLPDERHMDITVDYNTPMLDLLVCLAGKSKLSPTGLILQVFSDDSDKPLNYKPNQVIGSIGGRQIRLVNKKALLESNKNKHKTGKTPFEMTNRFIVNLPRGQKTVLRVSPAMTLDDLMVSVCKDKEMDPRTHYLQIPGKPGMPIDMNVTVGQLGLFEINLLSNHTLQERNFTASMPDLSQVPTYMPGSGETKKKKGFLSFLSKKDRKFKPHDKMYTMEASSTASHKTNSTHNLKSSSPPPSHRRVSDIGMISSRPKSMFVSSQPTHTELSLPQNETTKSQEIIAPTRKKRKAPAPPAPSLPEQTLPPKLDLHSNKTSENGTPTNELNVHSSSSIAKSQTSHTRPEILSSVHSRNSSESSGYHELTLSGCESPEAGHNIASKSKISIDSTSIESSDINNGTDSGIHESPIRVSPIVEVSEKPDSSNVHIESQTNSSTLPLPSRKKKKAPAPPAPSVQIPVQPVVSATVSLSPQSVEDGYYLSVQDSQDGLDHPPIEIPVSSQEISLNHQINSENDLHSEPNYSVSTQQAPRNFQMNEDPDLSDEDINAAFDINDILDNVTFDDEPKPLEIKTFSMLNNGHGEDAMMMMETSSITSENIEQPETVSKVERPCAFIPPPPPTEPPPPEDDSVVVGILKSSPGPVLIDKGTELNDDNTSLAPASMKNSPESVSEEGYKTEMALFVERNSKRVVENQKNETNILNDSLSSDLSISETNSESETGSVIQHLRTDSSDSKSGIDSWSKKDSFKINGIKEMDERKENKKLNVLEEITVPVETLPPPPQFDDGEMNTNTDGDEEEEYTETIEEIIIPLGPGGFDFTAARKVNEIDVRKDKQNFVRNKMDEEETTNGVFRAEPVSIKPQSNQTEVKKENKVKSNKKEEFVLTTDDLSSVSFLPTRPKLAQRVSDPKKERNSSVSSAVLILDKSKPSKEDESISTESIQSRVSQLSFTPTSEPETDPILEVKSISLLNRPYFKSSTPTRKDPDQHFSHSSKVSNGNSLRYEKEHIEIDESKNAAFQLPSQSDSIEGSTTSIESRSSPAQMLDSPQYDMLQTQFAQWQEQLAQNQALLSQSAANDLQADQLQQLTTQMTMQQNMMMQIQATMQALQQQKSMNGEHGEKMTASEMAIEVEQSTVMAPPPPPPPPPPAVVTPVVKAVENQKLESSLPKNKPRQKPKFEQELDPREQLMLAIRGFQGREGLKSVAKKDTKWIHSNR